MVTLLTENEIQTFMNKYFSEEDKEILQHSNIYTLEDKGYVIISEGYQIINYHYQDENDFITLIKHIQSLYDELVTYEKNNQSLLERLEFKIEDGEYLWLKKEI